MFKITVSLLLCFTSLISLACDENQQQILDGLTFSGKLKANNTLIRIGVKGSISFKDGHLLWIADKEKDEQQHELLAYQISCQDDVTIFNTQQQEVREITKDLISWQGKFDGKKVYDVTTKWTRVEKDFFHDMLLPKVETFDFNSD